MKWQFLFWVTLALLLALTLPLAAQEEAGVARVRIGYFAFDPRENDTYMDGELASFNAGMARESWESSVTPYFDVTGGSHTFAFVESGGSLEAAFLGPETVEFTSGHTYSLVIAGHIERDDLKLLVADETEMFEGVDPLASYRGVFLHNIAGAPPLQLLLDGEVLVESVAYGQLVSLVNPVGYHNSTVSTLEDEPRRLFLIVFGDEPEYIELGCWNGTYPGQTGTDFLWESSFIAYSYPGELTIVDAGSISVGEILSGELSAVKQRTAYHLHLDAEASLTIYVRATGLRTPDSTTVYPGGMFDPMLYIYDDHAALLYWNDDEGTYEDGIDDSGLEGLTLPAGDYTIQVGGFADLVGGPYELAVELAE